MWYSFNLKQTSVLFPWIKSSKKKRSRKLQMLLLFNKKDLIKSTKHLVRRFSEIYGDCISDQDKLIIKRFANIDKFRNRFVLFFKIKSNFSFKFKIKLLINKY